MVWFNDMQAWRQASALMREIHRLTARAGSRHGAEVRQQMRSASMIATTHIGQSLESGNAPQSLAHLRHARRAVLDLSALLRTAIQEQVMTRQEFEDCSLVATALLHRLDHAVSTFPIRPESDVLSPQFV